MRQSRRESTGHAPAAGDVPNEDDVAAAFPHGEDKPLLEQRDRFDEQGDDIRQYTGEPVETEHGTVTPQQMAVGAQRVVGGGEFPDDDGRSARDEHVGGADVDADERDWIIDGNT